MTLPALMLAISSPVSALTQCTVGQHVSDPTGNSGVIVWSGGDFCRVRYAGGQSYGWPASDLKPTQASSKPDKATNSEARADEPLVLRPSGAALTYQADALGHYQLTAGINGVPVHFLVDTGATFVSLSLADAAAVGIERGSLSFIAKTNTANGPGSAAPVNLREMRIGQVAVNNVSAVVVENLKQSLLGMSLLNRLKGFQIRDGLMTITR